MSRTENTLFNLTMAMLALSAAFLFGVWVDRTLATDIYNPNSPREAYTTLKQVTVGSTVCIERGSDDGKSAMIGLVLETTDNTIKLGWVPEGDHTFELTELGMVNKSGRWQGDKYLTPVGTPSCQPNYKP